MHSEHFLTHSHVFPLLLILTMCVMRFTLYKTYFMLIFVIIIAILSGNKMNKCSKTQLWSLYTATYLFASDEVNGISECVVNRNARE